MEYIQQENSTRAAGVVLARLGASAVTATDLAPNLPLLAANSEENGGALRLDLRQTGP